MIVVWYCVLLCVHVYNYMCLCSIMQFLAYKKTTLQLIGEWFFGVMLCFFLGWFFG